MTNAHFRFLFLFGAREVFPRRDLQIGVIALRQFHRAARQLKQAAVVGDKAGFFHIQLVQRSQIFGPVKALGRLHRIQGAAVGGGAHPAVGGHGLAIAPHRLLDGVLHGHGGGSGPAAGGSFHYGLHHNLAHKGAGRIVDGHQPAAGCQHAVFGALGPGGPAPHHLHGFGAVLRLLFEICFVLSRHQHQLPHQRAGGKCPDAALQHRLSAEVKTQLIKPHPGGRTCRQQNGRYLLFHLQHLLRSPPRRVWGAER